MLWFFFLLIYYILKKLGYKLSKIFFIFWVFLERNVVDNLFFVVNIVFVIVLLFIEFYGFFLFRIFIR